MTKESRWTVTAIHPPGATLLINGKPAELGAVVVKGQTLTITVSEKIDGNTFNPIRSVELKQE